MHTSGVLVEYYMIPSTTYRHDTGNMVYIPSKGVLPMVCCRVLFSRCSSLHTYYYVVCS